MNKWLVVHSLESYEENPRMIGFYGKTRLDGSPEIDEKGKPIPVDVKINDVKPGDRIVYYCKGDYVVKGIYEVVQFNYGKETRWPGSPFQFEIKPIIELEEPYDFKLLVPSLALFRDIKDIRRWGGALQGIFNALKLLTDKDYSVIEQAVAQAKKDAPKEEPPDVTEPEEREHHRLQYEIADWGIKHGFRVYVALNDKAAIRAKLPAILDEIPKFLTDNLLDIAKRIDVLFFETERDILTHAFEVEHTTVIYSGLLRLNDIAESYPSQKVKFYIVSHEDNRSKFERELGRPSFSYLSKCSCEFREFKEVEESWKELKDRKPMIF